MVEKIIKLIKKTLLIFGVHAYGNVTKSKLDIRDYFISKIIGVNIISDQKSENFQDLFVLSQIGNKGFFVEFGAADGLFASNTYLLEKIGWSGILAEPSIFWFEKLKKNRDCFMINSCVWSSSNESKSFCESRDKGLSTLTGFESNDMHHSRRMESYRIYQVDTISLIDLLDKFSAPMIIDYLSIDTEGSEYEILKNFNFDRYKIRVITCEHNYNKNRNLIKNLLLSQGYKQVYENLSGAEDWFILSNPD